MGRRRALAGWLKDLMDGDAVAIGLAIPIVLALVGIAILLRRHSRASRRSAPPQKKKLRWPQDSVPGNKP